ncbi:src kinase-associated phosphoprotein 2-like isoform X3 [Mytilus californianus]|uniref:src kinase-associated phosphoprotein 2-like isoform X3 n=1 Tax=Mytilus californianus TaxID=6549 RepID=UPI002246CE77|nr:src kinase-associated phosphoprotein 2-like isoform X3 [Mytilus californianus]
MSGFHESIKSLLSDIEKFLIETLKNEKLGKSAKNYKQEIIDKICKLKEEWPQLGTVHTTEQVKPAKDVPKDDESTRTGGSSNTDDTEDPYADSSADIPNVPAMDLTNFTKAGFLEKKRPTGIGLKTMQKRWCVIKGNIFFYFDGKTSKKMSGAFRLSDYSFEEAPEMVKEDKKKELCFKLVRPANRTYEFMATSKSEVEEWKTAVKQASVVVPSKMTDVDNEDDGDIYEPVGEEAQETQELYDDGTDGDIYEAEPESYPPEPIQDDIYDEGASVPIQEEMYEDASTPSLPTVPPPRMAGARPPPPPVPDDDPYQSRPLPPIREPPKKTEELPPLPPTREPPKKTEELPPLPPPNRVVEEEPKSYRNEDDFENMFIGKWDCNGDNDKELSFKKGDIIYIINRDFDDRSWWVGELNGKFGLVPKNYLTEAYTETLTF